MVGIFIEVTATVSPEYVAQVPIPAQEKDFFYSIGSETGTQAILHPVEHTWHITGGLDGVNKAFKLLVSISDLVHKAKDVVSLQSEIETHEFLSSVNLDDTPHDHDDSVDQENVTLFDDNEDLPSVDDGEDVDIKPQTANSGDVCILQNMPADMVLQLTPSPSTESVRKSTRVRKPTAKGREIQSKIAKNTAPETLIKHATASPSKSTIQDTKPKSVLEAISSDLSSPKTRSKSTKATSETPASKKSSNIQTPKTGQSKSKSQTGQATPGPSKTTHVRSNAKSLSDQATPATPKKTSLPAKTKKHSEKVTPQPVKTASSSPGNSQTENIASKSDGKKKENLSNAPKTDADEESILAFSTNPGIKNRRKSTKQLVEELSDHTYLFDHDPASIKQEPGSPGENDDQLVDIASAIAAAARKVNKDYKNMEVDYTKGLVCPECPQTFASQSNLARHVKSKHRSGSYPCMACQKKFTRKDILDRHIKTCHQGLVCKRCKTEFKDNAAKEAHTCSGHKCELCGHTFSGASNLSKHKQRFHEKKEYPCEVCGKIYMGNESLYVHLRSRHQLFKCSKCQQVLDNQEQYLDHVASMHYRSECDEEREAIKKKVFYTINRLYLRKTCHLCGKIFANQSNLTKHIRFVHDNDRFLCELCARAYCTRIQLRRHMQVMHGDGTEPCDHEGCTKKFTTQRKLVKHKLLEHNVVVPEDCLQCPLCEKTFLYTSNLNTHIQVEHKGTRFPCDLCDMEFKYRNKLDEHKRIDHHGQTFDCMKCAKKFRTKHRLKEHLLSSHETAQPFSCAHCNKTFGRQQNLQKHLKGVHHIGITKPGAFLSKRKRRKMEEGQSHSVMASVVDYLPQESTTLTTPDGTIIMTIPASGSDTKPVLQPVYDGPTLYDTYQIQTDEAGQQYILAESALQEIVQQQEDHKPDQTTIIQIEQAEGVVTEGESSQETITQENIIYQSASLADVDTNMEGATVHYVIAGDGMVSEVPNIGETVDVGQVIHFVTPDGQVTALQQ